MAMLKNFFPLSFVNKKDVVALIINIVIYIVVAAILGVLIWVLSKIPVVNIITGILGAVCELYCLAGIILSVLDYCKILK